MTELQRCTLVFAVFYVAAVTFGLQYQSMPAAELAVPFGLALAGTLGGLLYLRGHNRRAAYLAMALGGAGAGYTIICRAMDTTSPNHLLSFARDPLYRDESEPALYTEVYGCIGEDPDVRSGATNLIIDPDFLVELDVQARPVRKVPVDRGRIQARAGRQLVIDPSFQELAYGDRIVTKETELLLPPVPDNPNAFDFRGFLRSVGVHATLELKSAYQIRKLSDQDAATLGLAPCGSILQHFALDLRKRFTLAIKNTIPFPESSFVGGVLLGLRGGMETSPYEELREPFVSSELSPWQKLKLSFGPYSIVPGSVPTNAVAVYQATGTAHILAVSGLHVGIIAALVFGLLSVLRVPRQAMAFFIVPAIWTFTILVGFRPSTIRAATMTSIVSISYSLLGTGLRASSLFGLAIAAIIVLAIYPIAVTEASVTYSFGAILSLALLTGPFEYYLLRHVRSLQGYTMLLFVYTVLCLLVMGQLDEWPPSTVLLVTLGLVAAGSLSVGRLPLDLSFSRLPRGVVTFAAAQLAILAGLVFPLNSYYFHQLPISSPLGNIIALPGLTVIIFVAMLSVLLFSIPFVGPWLSLLLMAGNWFFIKYVFFPPLVVLFWLLPWPAFPPPTGPELILYFGLLAAFAWHQDVRRLLRRWQFRLLDLVRAPRLGRSLAISRALVALAGLSFVLGALQPPQGQMRLSVLHPYSLGRGGGHPMLIEAPWGEVLLVDGGPRTITSRANRRARTPFDVGERIVADVLLGQRMSHIDTVVISNFRQESFGGLLHILEHFDVERVVDPLGPDLAVDVSYPDFLDALGDQRLKDDQLSNNIKEIHETYVDYRKLCERREISILRAAPGMELLHPERPRQERVLVLGVFLGIALLIAACSWWVFRRRLLRLRIFDLAVLASLFGLLGLLAAVHAGSSPPPASVSVLAPIQMHSGSGALESNSLVLRLEYQSFSALLASDLQAADQERLLASVPPEKLAAGALVLPDHGRPEALHEPFFQAVAPKHAVAVNYLNRNLRTSFEKTLQADFERALDVYRNSGATVYLTQECGAVIFSSGGQAPPEVQTVRICGTTR